MSKLHNAPFALSLSLALAAASLPAQAADNTTTTPLPLYADGPYATLLGRFEHSDGPLDFGFGGSAGVGLRRGPVAFEINGIATKASHSVKLFGGSVDGLIFPFQRLPGLFALAGVGVNYVKGYPGIDNNTFNVTNVDGGVGYLFPLQIGTYAFGLRAQALYEYGKRQERAEDQKPPTVDIPAQSNFHTVIASIGFQFPLGKQRPPEAAPEAPAAVVPETTPPPAPPPPPKPECRKPELGEKVILDGCGAGDVIVLNGVSFEFNKATLTVNAKTILDQVSTELAAHPDIQVELAGHTDSRGTDAYNQKLSQKRAEFVRSYFLSHGIDGGRMTAVGYGETQPIASNDTDEGREQNRRVELRITAGNNGASPAAEATTPASDKAPAAGGSDSAGSTPTGDESAPAAAGSAAPPSTP